MSHIVWQTYKDGNKYWSRVISSSGKWLNTIIYPTHYYVMMDTIFCCLTGNTKMVKKNEYLKKKIKTVGCKIFQHLHEIRLDLMYF